MIRYLAIKIGTKINMKIVFINVLAFTFCKILLYYYYYYYYKTTQRRNINGEVILTAKPKEYQRMKTFSPNCV